MSDADADGGIPSPISELLAAINAERDNDRGSQAQAREPARPAAVERAAERIPTRAAERPAAEPRRNFRVVQQTAAADIEMPRPREAVYRVSAVVPGTPLPRERAAALATPLPRSRPQ